jgi:diguanylate cyclase (GGDEF)-like protein
VRYGGDEFVVLLPETEPVGARFVAERLRAAVEAAGFAWDKTRISVTVTIGVATLPQDAPDAATLIARADAALYVGKRAGRNRVVVAGEAAAPGETLDAPVSATGTLPGPRPSGAAPETADG